MKRIITTALLFTLASGIWATDIDWGGKIENISQGSNIEGEEFTQGNKAGLWLRSNFSSIFNVFGKAGYIYRYENEEYQHIPDISDLYAYGRNDFGGGKALTYNAGRFRFNDASTRIMRSTVDGVEISFMNNLIPFRTGIGYTGLVFNSTSEISMSPADKMESDDDFLLAAPRLLEFIEISSPIIAESHILKLALIAQTDLRLKKDDYLEDSESGKLHTQYLQLSADGSIIPDLFYTFSGALQTGQYLIPSYGSAKSEDYFYLGGMAEITLDYYVETRYNTTVSLDALYSSGDSWDDRADFSGLVLPEDGGSTLHHYVPVSTSTKGYVYTPKIGNLIYGDLSVSMMPVEMVQLVLSSITFMRAVDGPVFDNYISEDSGNSLYLGEEIDFTVNFRPFSDLGLSLTSGVFIPNKDIQNEEDITYRVGGYLSVSF